MTDEESAILFTALKQAEDLYEDDCPNSAYRTLEEAIERVLMPEKMHLTSPVEGQEDK